MCDIGVEQEMYVIAPIVEPVPRREAAEIPPEHEPVPEHAPAPRPVREPVPA